MSTLLSTFTNPPREFGILPFWFWNDDLDDAELVRQIQEFHTKGFGGFLIHPRLGLSRRVGYLTDEFFRLVRLVVAEAARLEMKVVLYDEGSYPSGSAQGQVVATDPTYAARCLIAKQQSITGLAQGYWHPNPGRGLSDELIGALLVELTDPWQAYDEADQPVALRCPGDWARQAGWETFAGRLCFRTTFTLSAHVADQPLFLDLGQVGNIAEVRVNDAVAGVCAWAPYSVRIDPHAHTGLNRLEVWVTNSITNFYEGAQSPSGILGQVQVCFAV